MTDWVVNIIDAGGYWGIGLLMVLENVFPPIPSELIMGIGGIRVGQGRLEMLPLLIAGTVGTTMGNLSWYLLGYRFGRQRLRPFIERYGRVLTLDWEEIEKLNELFRRHGQKIVFVFRFMPALRTIVSLPAGLFHMKPHRFILWTSAGALIWNIILASAGYALGANFKRIDDYLGPAATLTLLSALIFYVWRLAAWKPRAHR